MLPCKFVFSRSSICCINAIETHPGHLVYVVLAQHTTIRDLNAWIGGPHRIYLFKRCTMHREALPSEMCAIISIFCGSAMHSSFTPHAQQTWIKFRWLSVVVAGDDSSVLHPVLMSTSYSLAFLVLYARECHGEWCSEVHGFCMSTGAMISTRRNERRWSKMKCSSIASPCPQHYFFLFFLHPDFRGIHQFYCIISMV